MLVTTRSFSDSGWAQVPVTPSTPVSLMNWANQRRWQSHRRLELLIMMLERWAVSWNDDSWTVLITFSLRSTVSRFSRPARARLPTLLMLFLDKPSTLSCPRCLNGVDVSSIVWDKRLPSRYSSSRSDTSANESVASMWEIRLSLRLRNLRLGNFLRIFLSTISIWFP